MADFNIAFEKTLLAEGGYKLTNIANDNGGQTYAGISRKANPNWAGWSAIDAGGTPPSELVRQFYKLVYWDTLRCDSIISQQVAESMYDFGVNAGVKTSAKLAQIVVGVTPDGVIGQKTLMAINAMPADSFRPAFALAKIARYRDIVARDRTQIKFLMGWLNRTLKDAA
jgi:lysozyme family protein